MIAVKPRPKPKGFDAKVGAPGRVWLAANPVAALDENLPAYWRKCLPDLRTAYKGICAYYGCYVEEVTGAGSADHFVPKSGARRRAYQWSNYRFACARMNARKRDASDVLDPFKLRDGWFELAFPLMTVHPARALSPQTRRRVLATRDRLGLNDDACCRERLRKWEVYQRGAAMQDLWESSPFIALEAVRQGLLRSSDAHVTAEIIRAWLDG